MSVGAQSALHAVALMQWLLTHSSFTPPCFQAPETPSPPPAAVPAPVAQPLDSPTLAVMQRPAPLPPPDAPQPIEAIPVQQQQQQQPTLQPEEHSPALAGSAARLATALLKPLLKNMSSLATQPALLATALHGILQCGAQPSSAWLKVCVTTSWVCADWGARGCIND